MSDQPPEKPTTKLPSEEIQVGLLNKLVDGVAGLRNDVHDLRQETSSELKEVRADIGLVANDLKNTKEELRLTKEAVDARFTKLEDRATSNSMRARQPSEQDLELQAKLAAEIQAREAVGKKVDDLGVQIEENTRLTREIVATIGKAVKNPIVRQVGISILSIIAGWLASKGIAIK